MIFGIRVPDYTFTRLLSSGSVSECLSSFKMGGHQDKKALLETMGTFKGKPGGKQIKKDRYWVIPIYTRDGFNIMFLSLWSKILIEHRAVGRNSGLNVHFRVSKNFKISEVA